MHSLINPLLIMHSLIHTPNPLAQSTRSIHSPDRLSLTILILVLILILILISCLLAPIPPGTGMVTSAAAVLLSVTVRASWHHGRLSSRICGRVGEWVAGAYHIVGHTSGSNNDAGVKR